MQHEGRERARCSDAWWGSYHHRGRLYRASLAKWANQDIRNKTEAAAILDRMREAIRKGTFTKNLGTATTFDAFANLYPERYMAVRERGEFASRLVEKGVPLSQVRDLLGHSSIVTTERHDRQTFEALEGAVKRLDTGESFNFLSSGTPNEAKDAPSHEDESDCKSHAVN